MSRVCNIVLLALDGKDSPAIKNINTFFEEREHGNLVEVSSHSKGRKNLETNIYILACNYLEVGTLIKIFKSQKWKFPDRVELLVKDEHDDNWSCYSPKCRLP